MQLLWTQRSRKVRVASSSFDKNQLIFFANKCSQPCRNSFMNPSQDSPTACAGHSMSSAPPPQPGFPQPLGVGLLLWLGTAPGPLICGLTSSHRCRRKGGCQGPRWACPGARASASEQSVQTPAIRPGSSATGTLHHVWRASARPQTRHHHCRLSLMKWVSAGVHCAQLLWNRPILWKPKPKHF